MAKGHEVVRVQLEVEERRHLRHASAISTGKRLLLPRVRYRISDINTLPHPFHES